MRKLLFLPLAFVLFYACKPDDSNQSSKINTNDPKAVSSALKVWHGARANGNLPASNNNPNGPALDPSSNNQSIKAIAGKYAVIQPEIMSGYLAGYYVKVNGASDYFKVDYNKPREGGKQKPRLSRHNRSLAKGLDIDSTGGGNLDSSIVIIIPASIQPGQFCMTYCAYDSLGNVSNPITVCISVLSFGGDAASSYLNATWHITGSSTDTTIGWDPVFGVGDTMYSQGYCINGHIVDSFGMGPVTYPAYIYSVTQSDLTFASNGGLKFDYAEIYKEFNYASSSCSNYVYNTMTDSDHMTGAWSYNSTTGKMVLIFDFDDMGNADPEAYEYKLIKLSNNKVYLHDLDYDEYLRLEK
jgi:hypothetical protein